MRIGFDARFLTHPQVGGFKSYTNNLIRALGRIDSENEYVVYIDREPTWFMLPEFPNFNYHVVPLIIPHLGMPFREQVDLPRQIREDNLDLVHFPCNTAPINIDQKYVVTLHDTIQISNTNLFSPGFRSKQFKIWAINAYSKWTILQATQKAEKIITVSHFEKSNIVEQLNIDGDDISVTHLAPNSIFKPADEETKAEWRPELGQELNLPQRFILGIGYEPRKNISLLIEAFARIAPNYPDLGLVVVAARKQEYRDFEQLAYNLGLGERVVILGSQQQDVLVRLYNLADVFVFPSERESFGLPPLEAIACGVPTVAMNKTSLPEILQDGALLVDDRDVETWASAVAHMLDGQEVRAAHVDRGLKRAAQLTWELCAQETLKVYRAAGEGSFLHNDSLLVTPGMSRTAER